MAITNGGQFSFRPSPGLIEGVNEFIEFHQEQTGFTLKTDKEIFEAVFDVAQSKYAPYIDNSKKVIEFEAENEKFANQIDVLIKENKEIVEQLKEYQNKLSENQNKVTVLQSKTSDIIIKKSDINPVSLRLAERYLKTSKVIKDFKEANKQGIYNNYFDVIDTDNENTNLKNLMLTTFLNSAMGKPLPAITKNRKIIEIINKNVKKIDL